jgi:hypothetical protein
MTKDEYVADRLAWENLRDMEFSEAARIRWDVYIKAMDRELREHLLKVTVMRT